MAASLFVLAKTIYYKYLEASFITFELLDGLKN